MEKEKNLYYDILEEGEVRDTRSGKTLSTWDKYLKFDLREGFPAVTSKKLAWQTVVGELLWFLSGSSHISDLKHYTFNDANSNKWTIWTDDAKRWNESTNWHDPEEVGELYGVQWRNYNGRGVDQINNLITSLKTNPNSRYHIVMAWNPEAIANQRMALAPCHLGFQCYVTEDGYLNLKWWQRSVDSFLGLPFNIASYALLTHMLAAWTGLKAGTLSCDLGDTHLYENHLEAVYEYMTNKTYDLPELVLPEQVYKGLDETLKLTALDFKDCLNNYKNSGTIKAPLSVG